MKIWPEKLKSKVCLCDYETYMIALQSKGIVQASFLFLLKRAFRSEKQFCEWDMIMVWYNFAVEFHLIKWKLHLKPMVQISVLQTV